MASRATKRHNTRMLRIKREQPKLYAELQRIRMQAAADESDLLVRRTKYGVKITNELREIYPAECAEIVAARKRREVAKAKATFNRWKQSNPQRYKALRERENAARRRRIALRREQEKREALPAQLEASKPKSEQQRRREAAAKLAVLLQFKPASFFDQPQVDLHYLVLRSSKVVHGFDAVPRRAKHA